MGSRSFAGQINFSQVIPQDITVNNSINGKLTGQTFGSSMYGFDVFPKVGAFDLIMDFGCNAGRLRIYGDTLIKQKNPYFAPSVSQTTRICVGKFALHIRGTYDYDITRKAWRRTFFSRTEKITISEVRFQRKIRFSRLSNVSRSNSRNIWHEKIESKKILPGHYELFLGEGDIHNF